MTATTKPRERGLILSDDAMVRALLDGTKTQHWIPVDPQPPAKGDNGGALLRMVPSLLAHRGDLFDAQYDLDNPHAHRCPLGAPGDRLWLREAWGTAWHHAQPPMFYRATHNETVGWHPDFDGWQPASRMRREDSRLTVEIVSVRVRRAQDVTEDEAIASGARPFFESFPSFGRDQCLTTGELAAEREHRAGFAVQWDERHGDHGPHLWKANPWAWALTLQRIVP